MRYMDRIIIQNRTKLYQVCHLLNSFTHICLTVFLPNSIKTNSDCKIVYITRNPKDTCVSFWHLANKLGGATHDPYPIEKAFDQFCEGYLDHVLEYWLESLKMPDKILFLKYEDLKRDPKEQVKKSNIDRLKGLDVNKNGVVSRIKIPNSSFFRLGVVVDSKNYLTDEMTQNLDQITRMKLEGSGLDFDA
ncbi:hypothetical protein ACOSQ4_033070 [Xanthoceras sorbifolium]